jgi:hypothetical protein
MRKIGIPFLAWMLSSCAHTPHHTIESLEYESTSWPQKQSKLEISYEYDQRQEGRGTLHLRNITNSYLEIDLASVFALFENQALEVLTPTHDPRVATEKSVQESDILVDTDTYSYTHTDLNRTSKNLGFAKTEVFGASSSRVRGAGDLDLLRVKTLSF